MKLHIVYTESMVLLSKKDYAGWQEIQQDFGDYKASLGPWLDTEVAEYLDEQYADIFPSAQTQIAELRNSESTFAVVGFAKQVSDSSGLEKP